MMLKEVARFSVPPPVEMHCGTIPTLSFLSSNIFIFAINLPDALFLWVKHRECVDDKTVLEIPTCAIDH
uniref:Uncharacterized protein n=1 Tax=Vespula pensylvanica TaxID=30213 RepID=A0A834NRI8_VESPE|nr:hypothetical protein H0235_011146 [Vespula pensylvanica]